MKPNRLDALADLSPAGRADWYASLTEDEADALGLYWPLWARPQQLPPPNEWHTWLICAGRGFGKTRAGAEWVRAVARDDPEARIALVGASLAEVRSVMIEGESGILAVSSPGYAPQWEPSLRRLSWPGGARGYCYSAAEPESLRGPQHSHARGAGSEGSDRERGTCADRRTAAPRGGGRGGKSSGGAR